MKKKFNYKLTLSLVSLFISLLILIFFNQNKFGLFFGFLFLGASLLLYGYFRASLLNETVNKTNQELEETEYVEDGAVDEVLKELKHVKRLKRSTQITFYLAGGLIIVFSILMLF